MFQVLFWERGRRGGDHFRLFARVQNSSLELPGLRCANVQSRRKYVAIFEEIKRIERAFESCAA